MHDLAVDKNLMSANSVVLRIRRVSACRNLNLAPLTVRRDELSLRCEFLEFLVDTLLLNTALSLDER